MTIDEAIRNHKFEAKECRSLIIKDEHLELQESYYNSQALKSAEEHEQIAEWLEELKELKEKNTEKKVEVWANGEEHCPCCDKNMSSLGFFKHCIDCGQKLDWSDVE